jgi:hypothetical protein
VKQQQNVLFLQSFFPSTAAIGKKDFLSKPHILLYLHCHILVTRHWGNFTIFKWMHHLLVFADDGKLLGGNIHIIKRNTKALIDFCKEIGLEANAEKIMSCCLINRMYDKFIT